jgi:hypothetical protein
MHFWAAEDARMTEQSRLSNAEYLACMCQELAAFAKKSGFDTGSYLLTIAFLEFAQQQQAIEHNGKAVAS